MLHRVRRFLPGFLAAAALLAATPKAEAALAGDRLRPETGQIKVPAAKPHRSHAAKRFARARLRPRSHTEAQTGWTTASGTEIARASWYAGRFTGRRTASGTIYQPDGLTAAHPSLPLGSHIRVHLLGSSRYVDVTVTDRTGHHGHVIDLSRGAARELGILQRGTAPVEISRL